MSKEEFYQKMIDLRNKYEDNEEEVHIRMDDLLCELLRSLGYEDGIEVFEETNKWYS